MAASSGSIRLHALDNLRAALMWLGIVLHVSVNHTTGPALLPFRDGATTLLADMLLMFIHAFRMPAFFVLAGFLAALMVADRGHVAMFRNRVRRIALPFAVFWPLLFTAMVLLVLLWAHLMRFGTFGLDVSLAPKPNPGRATINTMHMWFIYYLFIFCAMAALACSVSQRVPQLTRAVNRLTDTLALNWWGVLMLAAPLAMIGSLYPNGIVAPDGSFFPNVRELVHNGLFFIFGWTVFRHRAVLLARFADRCWLYALAGTVGYTASVALLVAVKAKVDVAHLELAIGYTYGLTGWLWSVAVIGLFCRYLPTQNAVLRYLSDSSYWVFMVHMIGTIGFGALLFSLDVPAEMKMAINIAATTVACLATYHLFVRNTWIGVLLNGRRRGGSVALQAYPASV